MIKRYYVVTCPENGWDCVNGIYLAINEDSVYDALCKEIYGNSYSKKELNEAQQTYLVHSSSVDEVFTQAEIREKKINKILKED